MDISLSEKILILLREMGPLTADEIAKYLNVDADSVSEELKYLENDRLITKVKKGIIFRREAYDLTPTGADEADRALEKLKALAKRFQAPMSPEEFEQLINEIMPLIPLLMLLNLIPLELLIMTGLLPIVHPH